MILSSTEQEKGLLAAIISDEAWANHTVVRTNGDPSSLFDDPLNREVVSSVLILLGDGKRVDTNTVVDNLVSRNVEFPNSAKSYVLQLVSNRVIGDGESLNKYIDSLTSMSVMRKALDGIRSLSEDIENPEVHSTGEDIAARLSMIQAVATPPQEFKKVGDVIDAVSEKDNPLWSVSSGIASLDQVLGGEGFESGCAVAVAARAKMGKTTFLISTAYELLKNDAIVAVVSYETKAVEFAAKIAARHCGINWARIKTWMAKKQGLSGDEIERVEEALDWYRNSDLYVSFDTKTKTSDIMSMVASLKEKNPGRKIVLFVDYIQLQVQTEMRPTERDDRTVITRLSRFYKLMAIEMEIPIIYLAQINRDGAEGAPKVNHIKGSGSIEEDADTVLLLDRPAVRDPDSEEPKHKLIIDGSVTRTNEGEKLTMFIDTGTNTIKAGDELEDLDSDAVADALMEGLGMVEA